MGQPLRVQGAERGQRGEDRVAVVRTAAPIELVPFDERRPGSTIAAPTHHLGLLVEMPVKDHGTIAGAGHFEVQKRGAAGEPDDFDDETLDRLCARESFGERDDAIDVPVLDPRRIEVRRLRRDANVLDEARNDLVVPLPIDPVSCDHVLARQEGEWQR